MDSITIREMCKLMMHIKEKAEEFTKYVEDSEIEEKVFKDIYYQALRESDAYNLDSIKPQYLSNVRESIENYRLPEYLRRQIEDAEDFRKELEYAKDNSTDGNHELD